ncbi:hypothetical protein cypCar_00035785, partial [Cyprinus carpio]
LFFVWYHFYIYEVVEVKAAELPSEKKPVTKAKMETEIPSAKASEKKTDKFSHTVEATQKIPMDEMFLKKETVEESESMTPQPEEILSYVDRIVRMDVSHHSRESAAEDVKIIETEVSQKPEPSFELVKTKEIPEMKWSKQEMHIEKKEWKLEMSSVETSPEAVVEVGIEAPQKKQEIMSDKKKTTKDMPLQKSDDTPRKEMAIQREIDVHKKESIHLQQSVHENKRLHEETPQKSPEITPIEKPEENGTILKEVPKALERDKKTQAVATPVSEVVSPTKEPEIVKKPEQEVPKPTVASAEQKISPPSKEPTVERKPSPEAPKQSVAPVERKILPLSEGIQSHTVVELFLVCLLVCESTVEKKPVPEVPKPTVAPVEQKIVSPPKEPTVEKKPSPVAQEPTAAPKEQTVSPPTETTSTTQAILKQKSKFHIKEEEKLEMPTVKKVTRRSKEHHKDYEVMSLKKVNKIQCEEPPAEEGPLLWNVEKAEIVGEEMVYSKAGTEIKLTSNYEVTEDTWSYETATKTDTKTKKIPKEEGKKTEQYKDVMKKKEITTEIDGGEVENKGKQVSKIQVEDEPKTVSKKEIDVTPTDQKTKEPIIPKPVMSKDEISREPEKFPKKAKRILPQDEEPETVILKPFSKELHADVTAEVVPQEQTKKKPVDIKHPERLETTHTLKEPHTQVKEPGKRENIYEKAKEIKKLESPHEYQPMKSTTTPENTQEGSKEEGKGIAKKHKLIPMDKTKKEEIPTQQEEIVYEQEVVDGEEEETWGWELAPRDSYGSETFDDALEDGAVETPGMCDKKARQTPSPGDGGRGRGLKPGGGGDKPPGESPFGFQLKAVPLKFVKELKDIVLQEAESIGSSAVFECQISPSTAVTTWMKDGSNLREDPKHKFTSDGKDRKLQIIDVQLSDTGEYTCVAKLGNKEKTSTAKLIVEGI